VIWNTKNPFITPDLLNSCKTKEHLYVKLVKNPTAKNTDKYKAYRNIYNSLLRASKKLYYISSLKGNKKIQKT
jgi:hypothetical protein